MKVGDYRLLPNYRSSKTYFSTPIYKDLPQAALLILLKGGFEIEKISQQKKVRQKIDYTNLGERSSSSKRVGDYLSKIITVFPPDMESRKNISFYKSILVEACACLYAINTRQGTIAMLHCYRLLERIAFAMPLVYAQRSGDFKRSFDVIKSFFANCEKNSGELAFFKTSLTTIFEDFEKEFKFSYTLSAQEKDALQPCLKNITLQQTETESQFRFELTVIQSIEFLINIRNSFFHALSGKPHISLEFLITPDATFQTITPNFIHSIMFTITKIAEPIFIKNNI